MRSDERLKRKHIMTKRAGPLDAHIGARIRERRLLLGMTQGELADLLGIVYQQLHKYERAKNRISAVSLYRAAKALGVEIDWFFEGYEEKGRRPEPLVREREQAVRSLMARVGSMSPDRQDVMARIAKLLQEGD